MMDDGLGILGLGRFRPGQPTETEKPLRHCAGVFAFVAL